MGYLDRNPLCPECFDSLIILKDKICKRCGVLLKDGGAYCRQCRGSKAAKYKCKVVRSSFSFNEPARSLVHAFKYNGHLFLADFFASYMTKTFKQTKEFAEVNLIIPVPLHKLKQRIRGYNQAGVLASKLAENLGIEINDKILKRNKFTASQARLDKEHRKQNIKNAFVCKAALKGKTVLVVDDVATTTFTLEACADALKKAGAKTVYALTLAREL
ncbi:ComF family protein [Elusimicrobium posterum]|uniref:ComF family protein n=1 Tax=Elusimicrobium posterum TaxID=3116653 RepID=UPI003C747D89